MRATSSSAGLSVGRVDAAATIGMESETADVDVDRRERAQRSHAGGLEADLLVCFAERRLFERLARFDDAAGQRDLAAVPLERAGAYGQDEMRAVLEREEQQEAGRMANPRPVEVGRPLTRRPRHHAMLCRLAGKRPGQRPFEARDSVGKHPANPVSRVCNERFSLPGATGASGRGLLARLEATSRVNRATERTIVNRKGPGSPGGPKREQQDVGDLWLMRGESIVVKVKSENLELEGTVTADPQI